jgi:hypothetical protein
MITMETLSLIISLCSFSSRIPATFAEIEKQRVVCMKQYFSCIERKNMINYMGVIECIKERNPREQDYN